MERQNRYSDVGIRIKRIREEQGLSYAEFARELGITKSMAYNIESGRVSAKESILRLMAYRFDVRLDFLINGSEPVYETTKKLDFYLQCQGATQSEADLICSVLSLPEKQKGEIMRRISVYVDKLNASGEKNISANEDGQREDEGL